MWRLLLQRSGEHTLSPDQMVFLLNHDDNTLSHS